MSDTTHVRFPSVLVYFYHAGPAPIQGYAQNSIQHLRTKLLAKPRYRCTATGQGGLQRAHLINRPEADNSVLLPSPQDSQFAAGVASTRPRVAASWQDLGRQARRSPRCDQATATRSYFQTSPTSSRWTSASMTPAWSPFGITPS